MAYATYEEVQDVLARDASRQDGTAASIDEQTITAQIEAAESEINSRLAGQYTVPFNPVPKLINHLTVDIAAYLADLVFRETQDYNTDLNPVYLRYQRAQAMLSQLQAGTAVIPPDGTTPAPGGPGAEVAVTLTRPPLFSPAEFDTGWLSDPTPYWTDEGWAIH